MTIVGAMTTSRIEEALHIKSGENRVTDFEGISNMDVAPEPYMDVLEGVPLNRYAVLTLLMVLWVFKQFAITNPFAITNRSYKQIAHKSNLLLHN